MKTRAPRVTQSPRPASSAVLTRRFFRPKPAAAAEVREGETSEAEAEVEVRESSATDAFTLYMREIGKIKLLTRQQETVLAQRIRKGDRSAREEMIKANLRLVVKIARDYGNCGMPLLDLINEGNIGLMIAVQRFDPRKGAKLSTYAAWWIKQSIKRALANQSKTIRLPVHVVDKLLQIRRAETRLRTETGRDPSDHELSDELNIPAERIASYRRASVAPSSLDALLSADDNNTFAEVVPDEKAETPFQQLQHKTDTKLLQEVLETLDEREKAVLRARFGLGGAEEQTLEEIGADFGVTRERIRQIEALALTKLRRKIQELDSVHQIAA